MKKVRIGKHDVTLYNSIEEMPMVRFHKYNKMLLVDAGLGSDLNAIDGHIERAATFIKNDQRKEAATEMENIRQTIYLILQGMSPKHLAFAVLVSEIDGKPYDDISDEGLQRVIEVLGDAPIKDVTAEGEAVKKKIDDELTLYFPDDFDNASEKEYYDIMKRRTQIMLDCILIADTDERKAEIERLTDELVMFTKPKNFVGRDSVEISYDKQFEDMCLVMAQNLNKDPKKFNVMEFYNAYHYIKDQQKRQKRQNKAR